MAMINGNAIQPGTETGLTAKLIEVAIGFQEDIVRDVLSEGWIADRTKGQIIDIARVLLVEGLPRPVGRRRWRRSCHLRRRHGVVIFDGRWHR